MSPKVFYSTRAPYLQPITVELREEEADAAAGVTPTTATTTPSLFTKRVSSFSLLPRTTEKDNTTTPATTQIPATASRKSSTAAHNNCRQSDTPVPDWRLRDRMKTVGIGLILALNTGTDPPDLHKPHPCATLECWIDPSKLSRSKAKDVIAERLELQYAKWQLVRSARPLKYKRAVDPTVEDVRALCMQLRRQAKQERVLVHYNGHGVPRPTANGEIWVFDKNHTE
jgi:hypothetical protein